MFNQSRIELARHAAITYLTRGAAHLHTPCTRYGATSIECASVAFAAARAWARVNDIPITEQSLDYMMGLTINNSDDILELINRYVDDDESETIARLLGDNAMRAKIIANAEGINQHAIMFADNSPGKLERVAKQDVKLAAALVVISDNNFEDETFGDTDALGCASRVDRFVIVTDRIGFVTLHTFTDEGEASDFAETFEPNENEITENEALQKYDEYLTDAFGEIIVCGMTMDSGHVLKECDPIGYREGFNNWVDAENIEIV